LYREKEREREIVREGDRKREIERERQKERDRKRETDRQRHCSHLRNDLEVRQLFESPSTMATHKASSCRPVADLLLCLACFVVGSQVAARIISHSPPVSSPL